MKGFKLNANGDISLEKGDIILLEGDALLRQTVEQVVGTNKGEWWLNEEEGIDFSVITGKNPNLDRIENELQLGLLQVDDSFVMDSFTAEKKGRGLCIRFSAANGSGQKLQAEAAYR